MSITILRQFIPLHVSQQRPPGSSLHPSPTFGSHPNYLLVDTQASANSTVPKVAADIRSLIQAHRDKAVDVIRQTMTDCKMEENPEELEEKIFKESGGFLHEYIAALCHERIRLKHSHTPNFTLAEERIGKTAPTGPITVRLNPNRAEKPITIRWRVKKISSLSLEINRGLRLSEAYSATDLSDSVARCLEERYRDPTKIGEPFYLVLNEGEPPSMINVRELTVNGAANSLDRSMIIKGRPVSTTLEAPAHWEWTPQDTIFHQFDLEKESDRFRELEQLVRSTVPKARIQKITQLQHCYQLLGFLHFRGMVQVSHPEVNLQEKMLFYGSWSAPSVLCAQSASGLNVYGADPDPNENWGQGIHMSPDAWYADERAYVYTHEGDEKEHRQIFLVHAALGSDLELKANPTLKRPPEISKINHMPVFADSVTGTYVKEQQSAKVHVVYKAEQTCPAFLIDYIIE